MPEDEMRKELWDYREKRTGNYVQWKKLLNANSKVLEIGCGTGGILNSIQLEKQKKFGIDIYNIKEFKDFDEETLVQDFEFSVADAKIIPFKANSFDLVICHHVIEHMGKFEGLLLLDEAKRVLKPNGFFFIKTPNTRSATKIIRGFLQKIGFLATARNIFRKERKTIEKEVQFYKKYPKVGHHVYEYSHAELIGEVAKRFKILKKGGTVLEWYAVTNILALLSAMLSWHYLKMLLSATDDFFDLFGLWRLKGNVFVIAKK